MLRFLKAYVAISVLAELSSNKPPPADESRDLSITSPGQVAGKWLATLTIADGIKKDDGEFLASRLKFFF
jgi:hypothetical protein